jgi:hypothetical protein
MHRQVPEEGGAVEWIRTTDLLITKLSARFHRSAMILRMNQAQGQGEFQNFPPSSSQMANSVPIRVLKGLPAYSSLLALLGWLILPL